MRTIFFCTFLLSFSLICSVSVAEDKAKAKTHFDAGLALIEAENFDAALIEFEASVGLYPTKNGYFNQANCLTALHRYEEALAVISRLQNKFGGDLSEEMQKAVEEMVTKINSMVAELTITTDPPDANISINGQPKEYRPSGKSYLLEPGHYSIEATAPGRQPAKESVKLVSQDKKSIILTLSATPKAPHGATGENSVPLSGDRTEEDGKPNLKLAGWIAMGAGAALIVGGGITGGAALSLNKELKDECEGDNCYSPQHEKVDKVDGLSLTSTILFSAGIAAAATGAILILISNKREVNQTAQAAQAAQAAQKGFSLKPTLSSTFSGFTLEGTF